MTTSVLHVGCGSSNLPPWVPASVETRLDADARCQPDIVADMRELGEIGTYDAVFCSHALEHLTLQDGDKALSEFRRVLRDGGAVIILVPDLEDVQPTDEVMYESPMGPITGHDMYYGYHCGQENEFMRHKCGYVQKTLHRKLEDAGFTNVSVKRIPGFNLAATGIR